MTNLVLDNIILDEEYFQSEAEQEIERRLTPDEYEEVFEITCENFFMLVRDSINEVVGFNELVERNKDADKTFPHYKLYHRNENVYQPEFQMVGVFKNREDAHQFICHEGTTEFDEWRSVLVNEDGTEREVYKLHY